MSNFVQMTQS